jgi:HK97 gp10 family phage protein
MASKVPLADLADLLLDALDNIHRGKFVQRAARVGGERIANHARNTAPFTDQTGNLRRSIFSDEPITRGNQVKVMVGANAHYAVYLEFGQAQGKALVGTRAAGAQQLDTNKRPPSDEIPGAPKGARPFIRPAIMKTQGQVLKDFAEGVRLELKKRGLG